MTNGRILIVGSSNLDTVARVESLPRPGETVVSHESHHVPGGKGANQAVAAARLGAQVEILTTLGEDRAGTTLLEALLAAGVGVASVQIVPHVTSGSAYVMVDDRGENSIVVTPGANSALTPSRVHGSAAAFRRATVVGLSLEIPFESAVAAARLARADGARVIANLSPVGPDVAQLAAVSDVIVVNEDELHALVATDSDDWDVLAAGLQRIGCEAAVVTLGARGARVIEQLGSTPRLSIVDPVRVNAIDTTGCGDAFAGALMAALASGRDLLDSAHFAAAVAAFAATGLGAQPSYPSGELFPLSGVGA